MISWGSWSLVLRDLGKDSLLTKVLRILCGCRVQTDIWRGSENCYEVGSAGFFVQNAGSEQLVVLGSSGTIQTFVIGMDLSAELQTGCTRGILP